MPYIDIIIFAVIAVLLVLRLRSVLGQRTGYDEQPQRDNRFDKERPMSFPLIQDAVPMFEGHGIDALARRTAAFRRSSS